MATIPAMRTTRAFQLVLLTVASTSAYFARTTLGPLQETMRVALTLTDNQMALLQGPPLALGVVAAIPLGLLTDRYSRARLLFILVGLSLVANLLTAHASSFPALFLSRCLVGLAASAIWVAVLSLLADFYPSSQRGRATMVVAFGGLGGMSAAFALGGGLLAMSDSAQESWRWAMVGLSVPLAIALILMLELREPARTELTAQKPAAKEVYIALWGYRAMVIPLTIGFVVVGIADGAAVIWAAPALARAFNLSPDRVDGIMATILLLSGLLSPVLGGSLADLGQNAGGPRRTVGALTVLLFLSIPLGLFAVAPGVTSTSALLFSFLVSGAAFNVAVQALTTIIIPNELRGACLSLMLAVSLVFAFGVAPLVVSQLSIVLGGEAMIGQALSWVCVAAGAVVAVTFLFGRRHFPTEVKGFDASTHT